MWDPREPCKTLKAAQTIIVGISKLITLFQQNFVAERQIFITFSGGPRIFKNVSFFSPPVHIAWWAHMRRFLSVCPSVTRH